MHDNDMPTSEALYRAVEAIDEHGWRTGVDGLYGEGGLCILGALSFATNISAYGHDRLYRSAPFAAVADYLGIEPDEGVWVRSEHIWRWNDEPGRTADEVREVLTAAAVIEAAKENAETAEPVSA
jgi:hypothetical protein